MAGPRLDSDDELPSESARALVVWTIGAVALAVLLAWILLLARQVLLLIYVSGLLAIGFSPLVRLIERQTLLPIGTRVPPAGSRSSPSTSPSWRRSRGSRSSSCRR